MSAMFKLPGGPQFLTAAALQAQGRPVPGQLTSSISQAFTQALGRPPAQPGGASTAPPPAFAFPRPGTEAATRRTPAFSQAGARATLAAGAAGTPYGGQTLGGGR